ncbi:hypothetical protein SAMN05660690_4470 [Geodermatophilus telluris]|uniref:Anti-sigma regulatory factor (Ser/Thr protein kinase) n=1 Tax=Geodermatophilus telluris TaxID=1190417 RepID=A0A1G6VF76_9ACTN|nr:hypothetical protein [Geodermatophilus telluris]SDD51667.1 hypothetical protein SAMN05660690_4470 [Geodermatophilus telluris]
MTEHGGGDVVEGTVDVRRPAEVRAWVRERAAAAGCPPAVAEELVLLVSEVLVAGTGPAGAAPARPVRAVPATGGLTVEVLLPAPLLPLPGADARLAVAAAAATATALDARPAGDGGQWVRVTARA